MQETKLIRVLSTFSKGELKKLKDFIESPLYNKSKGLVKFYNYLVQFAPKFDDPALSPEAAFASVWADTPFLQRELSKLQYKLLNLVTEYIIMVVSVPTDLEKELKLLNFYKQRNLNSLFESSFSQLRKMQESERIRGRDFFYREYLIEEEYSSYLSLNVDDGTGDLNLPIFDKAFDQFYWVQKLDLLCLIHNRNRVIKSDDDFTNVDNALSFLKNTTFLTIPMIKVAYLALLLLREPIFEHYQAFRNALEAESERLDVKQARRYYTYLENTSRHVYKGNEYYEELFTLYNSQLEKKIIFDNGYIVPTLFRVIVNVALLLRNLNWTENFLKNYKNQVLPNNRDTEDVVPLCYALLYFEQKKYADVQEIINTIYPKNIYTKMQLYRLSFKVYYEMSRIEGIRQDAYQEAAEDLTNSFRVFLTRHRNELTNAHLQANRDFMNFATELLRLQLGDKMAFLARIDFVETLPERAWFQEKARLI